MAEFLSDKKRALAFFAALAAACLALVLLLGFGRSAATAGQSIMVGYVGYGVSTDDVDLGKIDEALSGILGYKVQTGFANNFVDGYTNIMITAVPARDMDVSAVKSFFDSNYPDLGVVNLSAISMSPSESAWSLRALLLGAWVLFCVLYAVFALLAGKSFREILSVLCVCTVSACISTGLISAARIPSSGVMVGAFVGALLLSALCCGWNLGNYGVLARANRKIAAGAAGKAETLGLPIAFDAAILALILLAGFAAGGLASGAGLTADCVAIALPAVISAFVCQYLCIKLAAKEVNK